jgi:hypothetical protein
LGELGARAMLGWTREELAVRSKVAMATLADFEAGKRTPYGRTLRDVRAALESAGIEFVDAVGVKLDPRRSAGGSGADSLVKGSGANRGSAAEHTRIRLPGYCPDPWRVFSFRSVSRRKTPIAERLTNAFDLYGFSWWAL